MNDEDRPSQAVTPEPLSQEGEESIDSLMRAVARVESVDALPLGATLPSPDAHSRHETGSEPPPLPKVGDVLGGRYELTSVLGAGGMGAVFAAKHKGTGREVAIKVLLPQAGGTRNRQERISRFVREARAAGRIKHPNVVDIYDVDGDSATPYLVMERLHGESMWQRIKRGPLPADEAVRVLIAAMHGVSEVHRQGVVHRDLKPDNIFLANAQNGSDPVPKVLDFGVSRILVREGVEPRPTTLTRAGYILGTPSYMPLEQLRGEPDVDARADVYALGVILYEALCGARPYEARNDHELVIRMATELPTPLAHKRPDVDVSLADIVSKALARDANHRFQDVKSFAAALERWRRGEREILQPLTVAQARRTLRWWLVGGAVVIATSWSLLMLREDEIAPPRVAPAPVAPEALARPGAAKTLPVVVPSGEAATKPAETAPKAAEATLPLPTIKRAAAAGGRRLGSKPAPEPVPEAQRPDRATKLEPEDF